MNDQASALRTAVDRLEGLGRPASFSPRTHPALRAQREEVQRPMRLARAITICSGKGGVGKSNLAVNLAVAMSGLGLRVCLLDADLGLANADVLCNLTPRYTLEHVIAGQCRLAHAALLAPGGFRLLPGASGVARIANLDASRRQRLLAQLAALEQVADVIIIDTAAGLSANVMAFAAAAGRTLVVTTPEPTALSDGYGMVKSLAALRVPPRVEVVVNMAADGEEAGDVYARLHRVARTFLTLPLHDGGAVPMDDAVPEAVRLRVPFVLAAPDAPATAAVRRLALRLAGREESPPRRGFLSALAEWLGVSDRFAR